MRRSRFVSQVFSDVTFADVSTISFPIFAMSTRASYRGGRGRGRGRGGRSFSDRPYNNDAGRDQFVTGDSHFQSVHDANLRFRHGDPYRQPQPPQSQRQQPPFNQNYECRPPPPSRGQWQQFRQPNHSPSNQSYAACPPPPFYQIQMSRPLQPPLGPRQHPPFNQNYEFRPPPPSRGQWQQLRLPNHSPSNQSYAACPPPPFYQNQMSQPPPQRSFRQRPRSKPSDYREWEYAKTPLPPGSGKFC